MFQYNKSKIKNLLYASLLACCAMCIASCVKHSYAPNIDANALYGNSKTTYGYLKNSLSSQNIVTANVHVDTSGNKHIDVDTVSFSFQITNSGTSAVTASLGVNSALVDSFNTANNTSYILLPQSNYSVIDAGSFSINSGATVSNNIRIAITNISSLAMGTTYILPVSLSNVSDNSIDVPVNYQKNYIIVKVDSLSGYPTIAAKPNGIKTIVYVEVNSNNPLNAGLYTIGTTAAPTNPGTLFFDLVSIFAANVNYDPNQNKAVIYFNQQVTSILQNRQKYIVPLQQKGQKVLLTLLPNHQGVGFTNFTSDAAIADFAQQIKTVIYQNNLDGVDFDDEYAEYGQHGQAAENDSSFVLLLKKLREIMPDKLMTLYNIGSITTWNQYNGIQAGTYLDYAWNPYYGSFSKPNIAGLTNLKQLGAAAIDMTSNSTSTERSLAQRTVSGGYGIMVFYNLNANNNATYLTTGSQNLFGSTMNTFLNGTTYQQDY